MIDFSNYEQELINKNKSIDDMFEKARSGRYKNTPENRRKGRVNQLYGQKRRDDIDIDTSYKYMNDDGTWDGKRQREVHNKIIGEFFDGLKGSNKPKVILLQGGTASGKSSATKGLIKQIMEQHGEGDFAHLDVDDIRVKLPEYKGMNPKYAARNTHIESSHLGSTIRKGLMNNKVNFINDGTLSKPHIAERMIERLRKRGYEIVLINVTVDIDEAKQREQKRYDQTGRKVGEDILVRSHVGGVHTYNNIKHKVDKYFLIDNNVKPRIIDSNGTGVIDSMAYDRFKSKKHYI